MKLDILILNKENNDFSLNEFSNFDVIQNILNVETFNIPLLLEFLFYTLYNILD